MIPYTLLEFDQVNSTSNFLKENQTYFPHMTIIRANHQTEGRGQFDRKWESNPGENLLFSILLKEIPIDNMYKIKSWVITTLMTFFQQKGILVYFKEPNDIYIDERKLCGILIETQSSSNVFDYVVVGVGLNLNQVIFEHPFATSMKKELKEHFSEKVIFDEILKSLMSQYTKIL
jgi:BirA family transcriptional regulator, biotin operon repressor / biotin---[acetyl-CoA-carboxylase] ligase